MLKSYIFLFLVQWQQSVLSYWSRALKCNLLFVSSIVCARCLSVHGRVYPFLMRSLQAYKAHLNIIIELGHLFCCVTQRHKWIAKSMALIEHIIFVSMWYCELLTCSTAEETFTYLYIYNIFKVYWVFRCVYSYGTDNSNVTHPYIVSYLILYLYNTYGYRNK